MPLDTYFDRRIFGPKCPFCAHQRMARLDSLARYPVFRCETCGTAIAEFALSAFSDGPRASDGDPRDPPVVAIEPKQRASGRNPL